MRVFVSFIALATLAACGFKGNLYLPQQAHSSGGSPLVHRATASSPKASAPATDMPGFSPAPYAQQPGAAQDASTVQVEPLRN